jgi:isochorismate hydrolase
MSIPTIEPYPLPTDSMLPANLAPWRVSADRAVLLVHDMQSYFLRPLPEGLRTNLVDNVAALLTRCRALGVPVAFTAQPGGMTEEQRGLLRYIWGPGMRRTESDRAIVEPLAPLPDDWRLVKWRYTAFYRSDLHERMVAAGRDQLIVCGVYAHVGILATAVDSFTRDLETFLVADAVADFSARHHRLALEYAAQRCAVVGTTARVLSDLDRSVDGSPAAVAATADGFSGPSQAAAAREDVW